MSTDPFFTSNAIIREMQRTANAATTTAQNGSRHAWSYNRYTTTGSGEILAPAPTMFQCTFLEQPDFGYGYSVDKSTPPVTGRFPRSFGSVRDWVLNTRGFYIGAWLFFVVDTQGSDSDPLQRQKDEEQLNALQGDNYTSAVDQLVLAEKQLLINQQMPNYKLQHYFQFAGIAFKDIPPDLF